MKKYENRWLTFRLVEDYWLVKLGIQDKVLGPDDDVWFKGLFRGMGWVYRHPEISTFYPLADREMGLVFERARFVVINRTTGEKKTIKIDRIFRRLVISLVEVKQIKSLPEKTHKALGLICAE